MSAPQTQLLVVLDPTGRSCMPTEAIEAGIKFVQMTIPNEISREALRDLTFKLADTLVDQFSD